MNEDKTDREVGAALWRRARDPWLDAVGAVEAPDETTLAAYLDGRLDEAAAAGVEAWMAAVPEALDNVLGARAALAETPGRAPAHVVARARGAVRGRSARGTGRAGSLFGAFTGLLRPAAWAGAAAALSLAAVSGFELGRTGVEHLAALDAAVSQDVRLIMGRAGQELL